MAGICETVFGLVAYVYVGSKKSVPVLESSLKRWAFFGNGFMGNKLAPSVCLVIFSCALHSHRSG